MKIKFLKDQKWVIDHRTVSFEKDEVKEIKDLEMANDMIRLGYGVEFKVEKSKAEIEAEAKAKKAKKAKDKADAEAKKNKEK